jgi:uncharacterized protein
MTTARPETLVRVRVQPRASRDEITAWQDDALRVRVTAAPVEGDANAAVRRLLARSLGIAPSSVDVVRGHRSRDKVLRVAGLALADVRARLAAILAGIVLIAATPAVAEHLTLDPSARSTSPPFDAGLDMRVDGDGFHIGGRLLGFGAWVRGRRQDGGVTVDGQLQGKDTHNFRIEGDTRGGWPRLRIEMTPGSL